MMAVRRRILLGGLTGGAFLLLGGCQGQPSDHPPRPVDLSPYAGLRPGAPAVTFPTFVTPEVLDGYQFALERPDVLRALPCYCGCGLTSIHRSNLDCFIAGADKDGAVVFDDHGTFCQICLDVARDARRLVAEGKSLPAIRAYVDERHGSKGPSTDTPLPAESGPKGS